MPISSRPPAAPTAVGDSSRHDRIAALDHPLPAGMRDLMPTEAYRQSEVVGRVVGAFELFGYERVALPVLEYADVLERGLGALDPRQVVRFVEPETGEVVALRPDVTPQIARLIATRLADRPVPARFCYEGSVVRRRAARARLSHQVPQAGFELVGIGGAESDLEVITVALAALRATGLGRFVVDLANARIASSLLDGLDRAAWPALVEALVAKDGATLERRARARNVPDEIARPLVALVDLHGGDEVWARADRALAGTPAEAPAQELEALWRAVNERGLAPEVVVDLSETWSFEYYTGAMFQILAEGPGEPVGSGGRYDGLFERFGAPRPAAGFALDLDNLTWALSAGGAPANAPVRVLVRPKDAAKDQHRAARLAEALRARGVATALFTAGDAAAYGRAWRYSHVIETDAKGAAITALSDSSRETVAESDPARVAHRIAGILRPESE